MARKSAIEWVVRRTAGGLWNVHPKGRPYANEVFPSQEEADAYMANPPQYRTLDIRVPGLDALGAKLGDR